MKLNAAAEMLPLSMANWNQRPPCSLTRKTEGYQIMLKKIRASIKHRNWITGLQPNSALKEEYAVEWLYVLIIYRAVIATEMCV